MHTLLRSLLLLPALLYCASAQGISRDPNGVNVNSQGATSVFITFGGLNNQVPVEAAWCGELIPATPDIGMRCDPATIYGQLPLRVDQSSLNASATVFTDIMSIPASVARRAWQAAARGENSAFFYVRRFVSTTGGPDEYVFVTCRMAGGGARVPLALLDVQLRFDVDSPVTSIARGAEQGTSSPRIQVLLSAARAVDDTGATPPGCTSTCEIRPTCQSWQTMRPPRACTASVTRRQPATCCGEYTPGVSL